ncbi:hypothetical protein EVAR_26390_1 [Eumeta japonica]|uniref:Uncharacterized protein n=1 Tax=Eumeta variegata TaxID=151549 RepID=A0A4C1VQU4_EUMVA|nr:hypothetical protein EVAR_26390_1 [Eumeta japonica]
MDTHSLPTLTGFYEFKRDRINLNNHLLEERPSTAMTEDNKGAVRLMIETDKRVTYQRIWTSLRIGIFAPSLNQSSMPTSLVDVARLHGKRVSPPGTAHISIVSENC